MKVTQIQIDMPKHAEEYKITIKGCSGV